MLETSFAIVLPEIRDLRFRADAGFGYHPILKPLEAQRTDYAVVARRLIEEDDSQPTLFAADATSIGCG